MNLSITNGSTNEYYIINLKNISTL